MISKYSLLLSSLSGSWVSFILVPCIFQQPYIAFIKDGGTYPLPGVGFPNQSTEGPRGLKLSCGLLGNPISIIPLAPNRGSLHWEIQWIDCELRWVEVCNLAQILSTIQNSSRGYSESELNLHSRPIDLLNSSSHLKVELCAEWAMDLLWGISTSELRKD